MSTRLEDFLGEALAVTRDDGTTALSVAVLAGALGAVQPKINAVLGARLGNSLVASFVNFTGALLLVLVALCLRPVTRRHLADIRAWRVPWWTFTAGMGGAVIVAAGAVTVETIGVAMFSVAFFAGQITFGLVVDRLGVGAGSARPVTTERVQAALLAVVAVGVAQLGRESGDFDAARVGFVVIAGAAASFQSAFNARIASSTGDPVAPTAVNVAVGTVALGLVLAVIAAAGELGPLDWPTEPWLYIGGSLGVVIVLSMAVASMALGVLRATLAVLAAQMVVALAVDWVTHREAPEAGVVVGSLLIIAAVAILRRKPVVGLAPN